MRSHLTKFLAPPTYANIDDARKARIIHYLVLGIILIQLYYAIVVLIFNPTPILNLIFIICIIGVGLFVLRLVHTQNLKLASYLIVTFAGLSVTMSTILFGGIRSSSFTSFAIVIILAGLLISPRSALIVTGLTIVISLGIYIIEINGWIAPQRFAISIENVLFSQIANFLIIALLLHLAITDLAKALQVSRNAQQALSEAINETTILLTNALDLDQVLTSILDLLARVIEFDTASIFLIQKDKLQLVAGQGHKFPTELIGKLFESNSGVFKEIASTKRPLCLENVEQDPRFAHWAQEDYIRGWIGLPLISNNELVGFLTIDSSQIGVYGTEEVAIATSFANQAATAILNAQLFQETQQRLKEQTILRSATSAMTESLDLPIVLQQIATQIGKAIDVTSVYICDYNATAKTSTILAEYFSKSASDQERKSDLGLTYSIPDEFPDSQKVIDTHQPTINHLHQVDLSPSTRQHMMTYDAKSTLLLPLIYRGEVIAFAELWESRQIRYFTDEEIILCQDIAQQATIALVNAQLFEETQQQLTAQISMREASQTITETLDIDIILAQLAKQLCQIIDGTSAYINLVNLEEKTFRVEAEYFSKYANEKEKISDLGVTYTFFEQSIPEKLSDISPITTHHNEEMEGFGSQHLAKYGAYSRLMLPVRFQNELVAYAEVWESRHRRTFTAEEIAHCEDIANQAAIAIRNSQLFMALTKRLREQIALRETIATITQSLDLPFVLQQIAEQLCKAIDVTSTYICSYNPETLTSVILAEHISEEATDSEKISDIGVEYHLPTDFPYTINVLASRQPKIIHTDELEANSISKSHYAHYDAKSTITLPMVYQGKLIAFAVLWESRQIRPFTEEEVNICLDIAQQATIALVNAQLYAQLQTEAQNLENKVAERTTQLISANKKLKTYTEELEQSNRELEAFAYVASHDLQEPLRKIQTFSDRLGIRYAHLLDDRGRDYLQRMNSAAFRMQSLIVDLLAYSRIATREQPFQMVDLNQLIDEVIIDLSTQIERNDGQITIEPLPSIEADATQIRQLFQNLISNSLKFHLPQQPPSIKIYGQLLEDSEPSQIQITVEDNGIGFDEKYLSRIFEVFQRLHGRTQYQGTGVGLAICRKIVLRHEGHITAQSKPNQGAKFIITLPLTQNKKAPQA